MSQPACSTSSAFIARALALSLSALSLVGTPALAGEPARKMSAPAQTLDAVRQVLFVAQPDGAVRVLNLRRTVGELGMLRAPQRRAVSELRLEAGGRYLWVSGDDARYRYDAHSLRLLERQAYSPAQLALASAPAPAGESRTLR